LRQREHPLRARERLDCFPSASSGRERTKLRQRSRFFFAPATFVGTATDWLQIQARFWSIPWNSKDRLARNKIPSTPATSRRSASRRASGGRRRSAVLSKL